MSHLHAASLLDGAVVRVADVACSAPRSGRGAVERTATAEVLLPRRGVFAVHRRGEPVVADPATVVVLGAGDEYRVSHPADGGDRCTAIAVAAEHAEEVLGDGGSRAGPASARTQLAAGVLAGALARGDADPLEAEEAALLTAAAAACDADGGPRGGARSGARARGVCGPDGPAARGARSPAGSTARRRAAEVRALLAARPGERWRLDAVARAVHCSPFHLARQFRAATGESIGRHLLRVRLALALDRLADGEDDLARLALDLGFAHHSHFTARFAEVLGTTPARARRARTAELRTILTAGRPARA